MITTLPLEVLEQPNLSIGDQAEYVINDNRMEIRKAQAKEVDFLATVNAVIDDYQATLERLVSR